MKNYLVDVPVLLSIYKRSDTLEKVFNVIKTARPSKLYIISDGPKKDYPSDIKKIENCRKIVENIDWNCEVFKLYFQTNQGMYSAVEQGRQLLFSKEDRCIYLEDDIVPSISFFQFCAELLEKYKDDQRINRITGMNYLGVKNDISSDYFFSKSGSIWGYATWKRVYDEFNDLNYRSDKYTFDYFMKHPKIHFRTKKEFSSHYLQGEYRGHQAGHTFYFALSTWLNNRIDIIPKYNMIKNVGFVEGSENATELKKMPKHLQKFFNKKTYEIDFPITHPKYIIDDYIYFDYVSKVTFRNNVFKFYLSKIESIFRRIIFGDFKYLKNKFVKKFKNIIHIE